MLVKDAQSVDVSLSNLDKIVEIEDSKAKQITYKSNKGNWFICKSK